MKNKKILSALSALVLLCPSPAFADLVWPALYLEQRVFSWWAISIGLAAEYLFVRKLTGFAIAKSALVTLSMNLASALLGVLFIPLAGIGWEIFPGLLLYRVFKMGTFNPVTWTATGLLAVFVNAFIEWLVIRWLFKCNLGRKGFGWLYAANMISVGLAFASLRFLPV